MKTRLPLILAVLLANICFADCTIKEANTTPELPIDETIIQKGNDGRYYIENLQLKGNRISLSLKIWTTDIDDQMIPVFRMDKILLKPENDNNIEWYLRTNVLDDMVTPGNEFEIVLLYKESERYYLSHTFERLLKKHTSDKSFGMIIVQDELFYMEDRKIHSEVLKKYQTNFSKIQ